MAIPQPAPSATASGAAPDATRRAFRDTRAPVLGGVAAGLAHHLAVPAAWVRAAFVVASAAGGLGIALYAGLWMFLPADTRVEVSAPGLESATRGGRRPGLRGRLGDAGPAVAVAALAFGLILAFEAVFGQGALFWPVFIGVAGVALLWRQADEAQRERWLDATGRIDPFRAVFGRGGWASYARVGAGGLLVVTGLVVFAVGTGGVGSTDVLLAGLLGIAGLGLVVGPWALRLVDDLAAERAERVRTQERADLAAHLHDSVLQTLALIQKNAHDPALVGRLARGQERDLRSWLFEAAPPGSTTVAGALKAVAAQLEDDHGIAVDVVAVGDTALAEALQPIVNATREALTNAAKHAGTARVDVYAEVSAHAVEVYVRDRGVGFDPAEVPADRHGVRESIIERMDRHGGRGTVRSSPGEGTEVRLRLPLGTTTGGER